MQTIRLIPSVLVAGLAVLPGPSAAQVRASEQASVSQTIDGTTISLTYHRPRARGRDSLFGGEIKWEEVWTPGANWATTVELNQAVRINGHPLPKGKYSLWFVVHPGDTWTAVFDTTHKRFHTYRPDTTTAALRFPVRRETAPHTEVLTFSFPEVKADGGVLEMRWATVHIPLRITVEPSYKLTMAAAEARPFVGKYTMTWAPQPPDTTQPEPAADSAAAEPPLPDTVRFELSYRKGSLSGKWQVAPFPGMDEFILVPIARDWFIVADMKNGEVYDVMKEGVLEFTLQSGRAVSFEMRGEDDELWATGAREP